MNARNVKLMLENIFNTDENKPFAVFVVGIKDGMVTATTRDDGRIGLPGGKVDPGESAEDAAMRESYEEGWQFSSVGNKVHDAIVDGRLVWWFIGHDPVKLNDHKEKKRGIKPILVSIDKISNSGFGNEWITSDILKLFKTKLNETKKETELVVIDKGCGLSENGMLHINNFVKYCKENITLPKLPTIKIVSTREGGMTTGAFNPKNDEILVYGKGRAIVDIMRTMAHELGHYKQRLEDRIKSYERDWSLEGEADSIAGKMVYMYAHAKPENMEIYD